MVRMVTILLLFMANLPSSMERKMIKGLHIFNFLILSPENSKSQDSSVGTSKTWRVWTFSNNQDHLDNDNGSSQEGALFKISFSDLLAEDYNRGN